MGEGRRFHLLRQLGAGGHGEVYLAEQESQAGFRRRVALKVLRADLGHNDQAARRMRDEARILGRLSHRHIVGVSDLVRLGNRWAVVMDYVPGADLDRILETLTQTGERFPPKAAVEAAIAVLRALNAAWSVDNGEGSPLKLIHRDIKPSNILLAEDGALKVLDFGVARVDLGTREAETGAVRPGTLRYMAPERLLGEEETPAGDVYATAVSIMELLVGEPLGRTPIIDDKHQAYIDEAIGRAAELAPEHQGYLAALQALGRAMAGAPEDRPSAAELERDLAAVVGLLPGQDLNGFAHLIIPKVTEVLGDSSEAISGTLHEATSASNLTLPEFATSGAGASRPMGDELVPTSAPSDDDEDRKGGVLGFIGIGVGVAVALVLLLLIGGGVILLLVGPQLLPSRVAVVDPVIDTDVLVDALADAGADGTDESADSDAPETDEPASSDTDASAEASPSGSAEPEPSGGSTGGRSAGTTDNQGSSSSSGRSTGGGSGSSTAAADPPPAVDPDAPRVSAAMFVMPEASALEVRCGDVSRVGTASVRLRNLPAGACTVSATYLDQTLTTQVEVTSRREVRCALTNGSLACR